MIGLTTRPSVVAPYSIFPKLPRLDGIIALPLVSIVYDNSAGDNTLSPAKAIPNNVWAHKIIFFIFYLN